MTPELQKKNQRVGFLLSVLLAGLIVYSLAVISTRGRLPEPEKMTRLQRILRGL